MTFLSAGELWRSYLEVHAGGLAERLRVELGADEVTIEAADRVEVRVVGGGRGLRALREVAWAASAAVAPMWRPEMMPSPVDLHVQANGLVVTIPGRIMVGLADGTASRQEWDAAARAE